MSARKHFSAAERRDVRIETDRRRYERKREAKRAHDNHLVYLEQMVNPSYLVEDEALTALNGNLAREIRRRVIDVRPSKPIHQCFLSIPLPVEGSLTRWRAVVRRSL